MFLPHGQVVCLQNWAIAPATTPPTSRICIFAWQRTELERHVEVRTVLAADGRHRCEVKGRVARFPRSVCILLSSL